MSKMLPIASQCYNHNPYEICINCMMMGIPIVWMYRCFYVDMDDDNDAAADDDDNDGDNGDDDDDNDDGDDDDDPSQ